MIIIRLQLAVYYSGNVQVKRMEDFSRLGGYKRFVNHKTYRKTYFFLQQNGQKNTVICQGWGAEKYYRHIPQYFGVFPRRKSHGIFLYSLSGPPLQEICFSLFSLFFEIVGNFWILLFCFELWKPLFWLLYRRN